MSNDLAGVWEVGLSDGVHRIEFEHGTTTGKRVISVDGKEVLRRDWMFKLVGKETFTVGKADTKATINIDAVSGFAYEYTLEINGKSLKKYMENRSKVTSTWVLNLDGTDCRVVLEKDTMDVWCNGQKIETAVSVTSETDVERYCFYHLSIAVNVPVPPSCSSFLFLLPVPVSVFRASLWTMAQRPTSPSPTTAAA
uniref:Fas apoptotic inhibitory molecule n=1 Tax=Gouania willdenowi TaxID=441366 RepID=A0A8C5H7E7_GOUWI